MSRCIICKTEIPAFIFPPNTPEFKKQIWKKENLKNIYGYYYHKQCLKNVIKNPEEYDTDTIENAIWLIEQIKQEGCRRLTAISKAKTLNRDYMENNKEFD